MEHTSCERWNEVVAAPERLRRAPLPPSTRETRVRADTQHIQYPSYTHANYYIILINNLKSQSTLIIIILKYDYESLTYGHYANKPNQHCL